MPPSIGAHPAALQRPAGLQHRQLTVLSADIGQAHQRRVLRFTGDGAKAAFGMAATIGVCSLL